MADVHTYSETLYDINGLTNREFLTIRESLHYTLNAYKSAGSTEVNPEQVRMVNKLLEEIVVR